MPNRMSKNVRALIERIERLGNGGADSLAVAELKELSSRCSAEFPPEEQSEDGEQTEDIDTGEDE